MKFFRLLCLLPALVILLATCKEAGAPTDANGNPTGNVTTTLAGIVTDESGQPVSGVAVIANGKNAVTDKYGTFMIQNAVVPGNRCFIICKKNGYFTGSRAEIPKGGGITELRLTLQSSVPEYTVNSSTGGTLTIGTASMKFPPSAFVTSEGKPFTGTVSIAAKHLDPSQSSFYNSFSGDMTARRTDGTQTELLSYGVLRVRLTDETGAELKLAAGKFVTLTYPIAASQQKTSPASMPLWYFDEMLGMWKEEGVATKTGDFYTGEVSHFTDWNCDTPAKTGIVKGRVTCNNEGISGIVVTVGQRKVVTDNDGYFTQRVPMRVDITISIQSSENFNLTAPDVAVPALNEGEERGVNVQLTTCPAYISGMIVDCNNKPTSGTVVISYSGKNTHQFTTNGGFMMRVPTGIPLVIEATAYGGYLTLAQSITAMNSGDKKDVGHLIACGNGYRDEFYDFSFADGRAYSTVLSADGQMIAINGYRKSRGSFTEVHDIKSGTKISEFINNITKDSIVKAIAFSDDGSKLLLRWRKDSAYVVNPKNGKIIQRFSNMKQAKFLPDGSAVISSNGSESYVSEILQISMYSVATGLKIKDFSIHQPGYWKLVGVSRTNTLVLLQPNNVSSNDVQIIHWGIDSDTKTSSVTIFDRYYSTAYGADEGVLSPDCSKILLGYNADNSSINFYDTRSGMKLNTVILNKSDSMYRDHTSVGLSNDMSFVIQGLKVHETLWNPTVTEPIIFSAINGIIQKKPAWNPLVIGDQQIHMYVDFQFNSTSEYLSAIERDMSSLKHHFVRIWKVK